MSNYFVIDIIFVALMFCIGLYALLMSKNLLRMLIGYEVMAKGVTLAIVAAGSANGKIALSQTITITVIVMEVVFIAVALAIVMLAKRKNKSLDVRHLTNLKG
jgi:NADH:ubiquinone oxidoreductase subunit K